MAMDLSGGGGRHKGKKRSKLKPAMNVTPLVDIVLVLLIVFMIITPLMAKQISVNIPVKSEDTEGEPPEGAEAQVILLVDPNGQAFINQDPVADNELPGKLRRVFAARTDQTLFFDAHDDVGYGRAIQILDIARGAGIVTIAVLTESLQN